jgi:hypothetical protein
MTKQRHPIAVPDGFEKVLINKKLFSDAHEQKQSKEQKELFSVILWFVMTVFMMKEFTNVFLKETFEDTCRFPN